MLYGHANKSTEQSDVAIAEGGVRQSNCSWGIKSLEDGVAHRSADEANPSYVKPSQRLLFSPKDRHSSAETRFADAGSQTPEDIALRPRPALQWVSSDAHPLAGGRSTASERAIRSHIMLDYRRKQRLAKLRTRRRPTSGEVALLPRPLCVMTDPAPDPEHLVQAVREFSVAHDEKSEAQKDNEFYHHDLHKVGVRSRCPPQRAVPGEFGTTAGRASRRVDPWAHIGQSVFTTLGFPLTARMMGHISYCKSPPLCLCFMALITAIFGRSQNCHK
jgi:hypothetical protein